MAFDSLSERLQGTLKKVSGQGRLTEKNMEEMLSEIRLALLEADVNFQVVKEFIAATKEKALGQDVLGSLKPGQVVVKIVHDELVSLLGTSVAEVDFDKKPTVIMMVGLQGSGKTTTSRQSSLPSWFLNVKSMRKTSVATSPNVNVPKSFLVPAC